MTSKTPAAVAWAVDYLAAHQAVSDWQFRREARKRGYSVDLILEGAKPGQIWPHQLGSATTWHTGPRPDDLADNLRRNANMSDAFATQERAVRADEARQDRIQDTMAVFGARRFLADFAESARTRKAAREATARNVQVFANRRGTGRRQPGLWEALTAAADNPDAPTPERLRNATAMQRGRRVSGPALRSGVTYDYVRQGDLTVLVPRDGAR